MFEIVDAQFIAPDIKRFRIHAPRVASHWSPGQFVIVRVDGGGERIPLTVVSADPATGRITLIVQGVGRTTRLLNRLGAGDLITDVAGPLGRPSDVEDVGTVVVAAGVVGAAIALPTVRALKDEGCRVVAVIGARSAEHIVLTDEIAAIADELIVTTDDGSQGHGGTAADGVAQVVDRQHVDRVIAVGPIPIMQAVAELTRPKRIPTVASLNPIMVDGTGMCGGCRVLVDGTSRFACVDGPEFDAHLVDFETLRVRNQAHREHERRRLAAFEEGR